MACRPVSVVGEIRPEGQSHFLSNDRTAEIQFAPGVFPCADPPALEGPFSVKTVQAQAVDDVPGTKTGFIPGFHIGGAMGIKIRVPPQVGGIQRQIPDAMKPAVRNGRGKDDVARCFEGAGGIGQAVLTGRNRPGHDA